MTVGLLPLLMLLGDGETLVVGVVFCAVATLALVSNAAAIAIAVRTFTVLSPRCELNLNAATTVGSLAFREVVCKLKIGHWNTAPRALKATRETDAHSPLSAALICGRVGRLLCRARRPAASRRPWSVEARRFFEVG